MDHCTPVVDEEMALRGLVQHEVSLDPRLVGADTDTTLLK
jgi:hypothetical protein